MSNSNTTTTPQEDPARACQNVCGVIAEATFLQALEYRDEQAYIEAHNHATIISTRMSCNEVTFIALAGAEAMLAESPYSEDPTYHADKAMTLYEAYEKHTVKNPARHELAVRLLEIGKDVASQVKKRTGAKRTRPLPDVDERRVEKWKQDMVFWRYLIKEVPLDGTRLVDVPEVEDL